MWTNRQRLDEQALIEIYDQYSPQLFRYAYRLTGDANLAEECVAESFSRMLQALQRGGGPLENVRAYLYRVAHNWITDTYRSQPPLENLVPELHADPQGNPAAVIARNLEQERVRSALLQLTPEQRQVIVLRFIEEWPHDEIASLIGKTAEATRALQHRAIAALRKLLVEEER